MTDHQNSSAGSEDAVWSRPNLVNLMTAISKSHLDVTEQELFGKIADTMIKHLTDPAQPALTRDKLAQLLKEVWRDAHGQYLHADGGLSWEDKSGVYLEALDDVLASQLSPAATVETDSEPEDLGQLLCRVRAGSVDAECDIIQMFNERRKELAAVRRCSAGSWGTAEFQAEISRLKELGIAKDDEIHRLRSALPQSASVPVEAIRAAVTLLARKITKLSWSRDDCRRKGQDVYVANLTAQIDKLDGYYSALSALVLSRPHRGVGE